MSATDTLDTADTRQALAEAGKYLTFRLGGETYGLPILSVREINRLVDATEVPDAPSDVRGVINLRGRVIPLLDLRSRFRLDATADTENTCTIIIEGPTGLVGIVVDEVQEVIEFDGADIAATPVIVDGGHGYVAGMAKRDETVTLLLDTTKLVDGIGGAETVPAAEPA